MGSELTDLAVFQLGEVFFRVHHCNEEFLQTLKILLPVVSEVPIDETQIFEAHMGCTVDLRGLLNHILKKHYKALWLDAAALVAPSGETLLLVGKSSSGKSTTAMALAIKYGWKVISEDITMFNVEQETVINFASPFSLKTGTSALLLREFAVDVGAAVQDEWVALGTRSIGRNIPIKLDAAIYLELDGSETKLSSQTIDRSEFIRLMLPYSNLIKKPNGVDTFLNYLEKANCFRISGGSPTERVEQIFDLLQIAERQPVEGRTSTLNISNQTLGQHGSSNLDEPSKLTLRRFSPLETKLLPDGHLVISDPESSWAYTLTPLGALVWEFSDGINSREEILQNIESFNNGSRDPKLLAQEINDLLLELEETGLLVVATESREYAHSTAS